MSTHIRPVIRRPISLACIVAVGLIVATQAITPSNAPPIPATSLSAHDTRIAIQILTDALSLVTTTRASSIVELTPSPAPQPPATTMPSTPQPATSPCPDTIDISNTGQNSHIDFHCTTTATENTSSTTNVSIQSSNSQTATGSTNSSSSSTSVTVISQ